MTDEDIDDLIARLKDGVTPVGLDEDNCVELFDVKDANEVMFEAAEALAALKSRGVV